MLYETLKKEAVEEAPDIAIAPPYIEIVETSLLKIFDYLRIPAHQFQQ